MNLETFTISFQAALKDALQRVEANHHGVVFVTGAI